jgi:hypothetical protein
LLVALALITITITITRSAWAAVDSSCVAARAGSDPATLPLSWRAVFEALIESTAHEGLPWSCPGGSVALALAGDEGPGVLTVTDAKGRRTSRPVASPEDVGPTGKALLASPREATPVGSAEAPSAPSSVVATPPLAASTPALAGRPPAVADPRLLLFLATGPRVSGPDTTVWMGGSLRGAIPFGPWALGVWTRFELPVSYSRPMSPWFSMSSVSLGLSGGRSFPVGPLALEALFVPSVAVVSMEEVQDEAIPHPEGARVGVRLGVEAAATAPISSLLRARLAIDGEVAPAYERLIADGFPRLPRYTLGLVLGLEAVVH